MPELTCFRVCIIYSIILLNNFVYILSHIVMDLVVIRTVAFIALKRNGSHQT